VRLRHGRWPHVHSNASRCGGSACSWAQQSETDQQAGLAVFKETLHQSGWIDGSNARVEVRWAGGNPVEARKDAEELVALPADVIMTNGQFTLQTLLQATRSVPIVFNGTVDPVGSGFIDSLARPVATQLALFCLNMP
jgi:putative tryptophan/tyrosine transport system substrate-binding protein